MKRFNLNSKKYLLLICLALSIFSISFIDAADITITQPTANQIFTQLAPTAIFNITAMNMSTCKWSIDSGVNNYTMNKTNITILGGACYQETANVSTACGGLDSGNYYMANSSTNIAWTNPERAYDGNWGTYASMTGASGYMQINYTIPAGATNGHWKVLRGVETIEVDFNDSITGYPGGDDYTSCWTNAGGLSIKYTNNFNKIECMGSTGWILVEDLTGGGAWIYEEAMNWTIPASYTEYWGAINTTMIDGSSNVIFYCNKSSDGSWVTNNVSFEVDSINITRTRNLNVDGRNYLLLNDITYGLGQSGIEIFGDSINLNLNNKKVTGGQNNPIVRINSQANNTYIHDGIITNGSVCIDIWGDNNKVSYISRINCTSNLNYGLRILPLSDNNFLSVNDSTLTGNSDNIDFEPVLGVNNIVNLTNVSYNSGETYYGPSTGSKINRIWYLNSRINSSISNLQNANITIYNSTNQIVYSSLTDSNGLIPQQTVLEYSTSDNGKIYQTPHNITVSKAGYITNSTIVNFTATTNYNHLVTLQTQLTSSIIYPVNLSYLNYNQSVSLNFTIINATAMSKCLWTVNNYMTNTTIANCQNTTFNLPDGNYLLKLWANDSTNNVVQSSVNVTIDTTKPLVQMVYPTATNYSSLSSFNYTLTETNKYNCWYTLNDSAIHTITCGQNESGIIDLVQGYNTWTIYANDSAGNTNSSNVTFFYDSQNPAVTLLSPLNNTHQNQSSNNYTANLTDNLGIRNATLFIYNQTTLVNQTTISYAPNTITATIGIVVTLIDNAYNWFYRIFDWAGNSVTSQNFTSNVDTGNLSFCHPIDYPGTYYLNQTITATGDCFNIRANNVVFDCNSWSIKGPGGANGIYTNGYSNITIQNCNITNFANQINLTNSQNSSILNFFSKSNSATNYRGINLANTKNIALNNITITNIAASTFVGIYLTSTNITTLRNSTINSNTGSGSAFSIYSVTNDYTTQIYNSNIYNIKEQGYNFLAQDSIINYTNLSQSGAASRNNYLINVTMNTNGYGVSGQTTLYKQWYFNVNVNKSNGDTDERSTVNIWDKFGIILYGGTSNSSGTLNSDLTLSESLINETSPYTFYQTPHTVNISYTAFNTNSSLINFTALRNNILTVTLQLADAISPLVQLVYPTAGNYSSLSELNYTVDATASSCWYTLNDSSVHSIACGTNESGLTPLQGYNTWTVYSNDSLGNTNSSNVTFFYDSITPLIDYGIGTQNSGVNLSVSNIYVNTTWTELNFRNITFNLYNSSLVNSTTYTVATYKINWTGLADGTYTYNVTICDTVGNCNYTTTRRITLDITAPNATLLTPSNNTLTSINSNNFTVNLSDATSGIKNATLFIYNQTTLVNQTTVTFSGQITSTLGIVVNLVQNVYTWFYNLFDFAGNSFTSTNNTLTIDTTNPTVTITYPSANNLWYNSNIGINFTTDGTNCWWTNNSGASNYTLINCANISTQSWAQGSNTVIIYTNDSAGNTGSATRQFNIDTVYPLINMIYPLNISYMTVSSFNYTLTETNNYNCWYTLNDSSVHTITCGANETGLTTVEGSNTWTIYANDSAGNINSSSVVFFIDTTGPSLNIVSPTAIAYGVNNISLNYTVSDDGVGLSSCWYRNDTDSLNITIPCGTNTTISNSDGTHTIYMWANDTFGNLASDSVTYSISTSLPAITLNNPTSNKYLNYANNIIFNATVITATLDTCQLWGNWSGWHLNQSVTGITSNVEFNFNAINLSEGNYIWNVWCNTSLGNSVFSSANRSFTIDTTYPLVDFGSNTATDGANLSQSNIYMNVVQTELNFKNITFRVNNSKSQYFPITFGAYNFTNLANGIYNINITVCDKANNCNITSTRRITLDTIQPNVTFNSPEDNLYTNIITQNLSANLTDNLGIKNATLYIDGISNSTITFGSGITTTNWGVVLNLSDGSHNWSYVVYDWAGNVFYSTVIQFNIDTINPKIEITFPQNNSWYNHSLQVSYNASDANSITCKTSFNGGVNVTRTCNQNISLSWSAHNNLTIYAIDSAGNVNSSTISFNIDTTNPTANLLSPSNNTYSSNHTQNLTVNITDDFGIRNASLYINGTLNSTVNFGSGVTTSTLGIVVNLVDNVYTWFYRLFDWAGNIINSDSRTLNIDSVQPGLQIITPANTTYSNPNILLNVSFNDLSPIYNYWYTLSDGATHSFTNPQLETFNAGSNNLTVWANDSAGNLNSTNRIFYVTYTNRLDLILNYTPSSPEIGSTLVLNAITSTDNTDITECNFSLSSPTTLIYNNVKGTGTTTWISNSTLINEAGTYTFNVTCINDFGVKNSSLGSFVISPYNLTINQPSNPFYISVALSNTELQNILFQLYDNVDTTINYTVSVYIQNQSNFTIDYPKSFILNAADSSTSFKEFFISFVADSSTSDGLYAGNVTLNNTVLGTQTVIQFSYGINPPAAIPILYKDNTAQFSSRCISNGSESGYVCYANLPGLYQGTTWSNTYYMATNPNYPKASNCSIATSPGIKKSWITITPSSVFDLSDNAVTNPSITLSLSPTSSTTPTIYEGTIYVHCNQTNSLGHPSDSLNRIPVRINILASPNPPGDDGGGGGGGGPELNLTNLTEQLTQGICGNYICENGLNGTDDYGENYLSCPVDCQGNLNPIYDCFNGGPDCILRNTTVIFWIGGFILGILLLTTYVQFNKKSGPQRVAYLPTLTLNKTKSKSYFR